VLEFVSIVLPVHRYGMLVASFRPFAVFIIIIKL